MGIKKETIIPLKCFLEPSGRFRTGNKGEMIEKYSEFLT